MALALLRRAQQAFSAYHAALELTSEFLALREAGKTGAYKYYSAVGQWERFVLEYSMGCEHMGKFSNVRLFEKGDGSIEQRLYDMANTVKHTGSSLSAMEAQYPALPLWLSNRGLHTYDLEVTFKEAAEALEDMGTMADRLQDPGAANRDAASAAG